MNLQSKWYKVKHLDSKGVVTHYVVNLSQLMSLVIGLEDGEFLEFTSTKVVFSFICDSVYDEFYKVDKD